MAVLAQWCIRFTFRDAKGQTRHITLCYESDGASNGANFTALQSAASATVTALQGASNAWCQSESVISGGTSQSGLTYGATGQFQSVADQARLYFNTTNPAGDPSAIGVVTIPAPKAAIFEADLVTVNPTNSLVVALTTALNVGGSTGTAAVACTASGFVFTSLIGGVRITKKLSRRWSKFTKDPTLTIAGI